MSLAIEQIYGKNIKLVGTTKRLATQARNFYKVNQTPSYITILSHRLHPGCPAIHNGPCLWTSFAYEDCIVHALKPS